MIDSLEKESKSNCDIWKGQLKYDIMMNHIIKNITNWVNTMARIITIENNMDKIDIKPVYVLSLPMNEVLAPMTYEKVVSMIESIEESNGDINKYYSIVKEKFAKERNK